MSTTGAMIPEINTTAAGPVPGGEEAPTDSHAIAAAPLEEHPEAAGALHHEAAVGIGEGVEVKDLGWNKKPEEVPSPLIGGLSNEELWTLVRRFNKVHIRPLIVMRAETDTMGSKCTMSKLPTNAHRAGSISMLLPKTNFLQTSSVAILNVST